MPEVSRCPACGTEQPSDASVRRLCPQCLLGLALDPGVGGPGRSLASTELATEPHLAPGGVLGNRYQIRALLGRGGMGEVWHAFDLKLRVEVALKALRPEFLADERRRELLRAEVRAAREVISPNVCRVFDLILEAEREMVSMEYIDGMTLAEIVRSRGPMDLREASEIASQFLAGLEAIHQAGLVHRDLKPENIMITRAGRVVVMDLGIAKALADCAPGAIAGTPGYMAPEQARGDPVDAAADVFASGVILAEMVALPGDDPRQRRAFWQGLREQPPKLPEGPWREVLERVLAWRPEDRYQSARAVSRALEEVSLRVGIAREVRPYPGLAVFTEEDAEYFFGREQEVETLWKRLRRPHLQAVIGASGAGKSSFLRAGLLPAMPAGWSSLLCTPGDRPFTMLGQALATELAGDTDAVRDLLRFDELDVAVSTARRWRQRHDHVLLIVDQFEELFTLNSEEVQRRFAELLARLALEADVHVLVSLRDDFLMHCHRLEALRPIFTELIPLGAPSGAALRRALVQPALLCGFRFEDDGLVDDMLEEVAEERGALPLLAFAVAALWQRRDRERGLLTRAAYDEIGGVAGALARHAEATLERVGAPRLPIVRELFRNLVTSQGTRVVQDVDELLSVFEERQVAAEVLQQLIDARLLTSFELTGKGEEQAAGRRVEIIHESLLVAWPRLVRWRTREADDAHFRDQLRQAAQLWEERGRPLDLLWSGTSFREFSLWRERYSGGLTGTEKEYAKAMESHAVRRQRRQRLAVAATVALLVGVVAVISALWLESRRSERQAIAEARRAEASKLFALGQLETDEHPAAALAYAIRSLELADSAEVRRFAVETLWRGPTAFVLATNDGHSPLGVRFSRDGKWLFQSSDSGRPRLWSGQDGKAHWLEGHEPDFVLGAFSTDSRRLLTSGRKATHVWSLPAVQEIGRREEERSYVWAGPYGDYLLAWHRQGDRGDGIVRRQARGWPIAGGEPETLGVILLPPEFPDRWTWIQGDPDGERIVVAAGGDLYELPLRGEAETTPRHLHRSADPIRRGHLETPGDRLVTEHASGQLHLWRPSSDGDGFEAIRAFAGNTNGPSTTLDLDPGGRWLAAAKGWDQTVELWDVAAPTDSAALSLRRGEVSRVYNAQLHPSGQWLAVADTLAVSLWPLSRPYPRVIADSDDEFRTLAFHPRGDWLAACTTGASGGGVWILPLSPTAQPGGEIFRHPDGILGLEVSPSGDLIAAGSLGGEVFLLSPAGAPVKRLGRLDNAPISALAFDGTGRRLAVGGNDEPVIKIWDLVTEEEIQVLDPGEPWPIPTVEFTSGGRLLAGSIGGGMRLWDLAEGTSKLLMEGRVPSFRLSPDGRWIVGISSDTMQFPSGKAWVYDLEKRTSRVLESHGAQVSRPAWDRSGTLVVSPSLDGSIRVGPMSGEEPHLLLGHEMMVWDVAVDPSGKWIASASADGKVQLWPLPEGRPFHTLPYQEILARLRSLTNYRVVEDEGAASGYRIDFEPFPGWEHDPPSW